MAASATALLGLHPDAAEWIDRGLPQLIGDHVTSSPEIYAHGDECGVPSNSFGRTTHAGESMISFVRSARVVADLVDERIERGATDRAGFWGHYLQYLAHETLGRYTSAAVLAPASERTVPSRSHR